MEDNQANFEDYMLSHTPIEYHQRILQSHQRLGIAATKLCEANIEYNQAITERLNLNKEIRGV